MTLALTLALTLSFLAGVTGAEPESESEEVVAALQEMQAYRVPAGLRVELFAADPQVQGPVAIGLDERNRVFVAEEHRFNRGAEENRTRPFLLDDDLQLETVDDRLAMFRKWQGEFEGGMGWFRRWGDQVRLLEDRDGDGRADRATVFAGPFNDPLDGMAAGVLAHNGDVYLTCIPHLWRLRDDDGDGRAERRESLHRGFGVNAAFLGHDLHGLTWGVDGRLYFSVGDRGFHVVTHEGRTLHGPRTGAVFRCEADGADLEVVHRGLRNPQEIAFDQNGDLFAADNNCDKGDDSRLVYVLPGADSGWNMAYQSLAEPYLTGPWHAERMWHLPPADQPRWIVPPVGKLGAGPAGLAFCSGVGLPARYRNRFLFCNFTGAGGIESFGVAPRGAGFEIVDHHDFLKPARASDVDLGYDGKIYFSHFGPLDWSGSTVPGRIYTVFDPHQAKSAAVEELRTLATQGLEQFPVERLGALLGHADMRIRLRAQFALARSAAGWEVLRGIAASGEADSLRRRHGVWGLGHAGRRFPEARAVASRALAPLLADPDAEIRGQAAHVAGELRLIEHAAPLIALMADPAPRVRLRAALAAARIAPPEAREAAVAMLSENDDADPFLRHGAVLALASAASPGQLLELSGDSRRAVRLGAVLALRRREDPAVAAFLDDPSPDVVLEAARAIHDLPLESATAALARWRRASAAEIPDPLARRVIHANYLAGGAAEAAAVVAWAVDRRLSQAARSAAIRALSRWGGPQQRDQVTGFWRPVAPRDDGPAREAVQRGLADLLAVSADVQAEMLELLQRLRIEVPRDELLGWVEDPARPGPARAGALRLLASRSAPPAEAVERALRATAPEVRAAARELVCRQDLARGLELLSRCLDDENADIAERQAAIALLAALAAPSSDRALERWLDRLLAEQAPEALQLDIVSAAQLRAAAAAPLQRRVEQLETRWREREQADPLARQRVALHGGDPLRGRDLFVNHPTAQCIRCHRAGAAGGSAGPDLAGVAKRLRRDQLLESIVAPNALVAPGYGLVQLQLESGEVVAGTLKSEAEGVVVLQVGTDQTREIDVESIVRRTAPTSPMPSLNRGLGLHDLRDLVAFLASLDEPHPNPPPAAEEQDR